MISKKKSMPNDYDSDPWIRTPKYARFGGENVMIGQLRQFWQILIFHGNPASRQDCET